MKLAHKHLITGKELTAEQINELLVLAQEVKKHKSDYAHALSQKNLALIFEKPSLRTRFSFMAGMHELGGHVIESTSNTRKAEEPEDQMRVLQGYCDIVMVRTYADDKLERMQSVATIPLINGLSDLYHPCQILADLLTLKEKFGDLNNLKLCYIGDGNNILHSLLVMAPQLGMHIHYCCPPGFSPNNKVLNEAKTYLLPGNITVFQVPKEAVKGCHAVYTDVWTSMGQIQKDEKVFMQYQVNESLMQQAESEAVFMHCMPMNRGKEVSATLPDQSCSVIFQQSENRLHVQKALLLTLLKENSHD